MGGRKSIQEKLKLFKKEVNKNYPITKMILFGSRARNRTGRDRDIDLIIVSPKFRKLDFFQRGARMYDYWNLRYPVDFLCFSPEEFEKKKRQVSIVSEAMKEGIVI